MTIIATFGWVCLRQACWSTCTYVIVMPRNEVIVACICIIVKILVVLTFSKTTSKLNVYLTVHHELTIQNYQRDALNIIYSSNIITLLYMFRVSSTHLQEDIVVHK